MTKKLLISVAAAVAWFIPGHLAILALLVFFWGTAMASTTNTAKARSTEARLAAHVTATAPAVNLVANGGTIGGALTVSGNTTTNGSHTVTGNLGVSGGTTLVGTSSCSNDFTVGGSHTVNGNMGVQGGTTLVGSSSCSNDFTTGGSHTVNSNLGVHGGTTMIGASSCSSSFAISGGPGMPNGSLGSAPGPPSGGSTSTYAGNFFTGSGAAVWAQGISNTVDAIISALQVNNVTN